MAKTKSGISSFKERIAQYEYELILFVFLLLRFIFKNILSLKEFFTEQAILGLSDNLNIAIGSTVLLLVCIFLAAGFGRLIRKNGVDNEKSFLVLVALFFACPATLPFLFDIKSASGTLLLYPFALFIVAVLLVSKPFFKWFVPVICAIYFLPSMYTSEILFAALRKGAVLYVPLILLFSYLNMMKPQIEPVKKQMRKVSIGSSSTVLFIISSLVTIGSYMLTLSSGQLYYSPFFITEQRFDGYLAVCLIIAAPALAAVAAVFYNAIKNKFPVLIVDVFWQVPIVLLLLFKSNFYGLWVPFLLISLFIVVFYGIGQKNSAMLAAVRKVGDFCLERQFIFFIILILMASLSNISSPYLSDIFKNIFEIVPY